MDSDNQLGSERAVIHPCKTTRRLSVLAGCLLPSIAHTCTVVPSAASRLIPVAAYLSATFVLLYLAIVVARKHGRTFLFTTVAAAVLALSAPAYDFLLSINIEGAVDCGFGFSAAAYSLFSYSLVILFVICGLHVAIRYGSRVMKRRAADVEKAKLLLPAVGSVTGGAAAGTVGFLIGGPLGSAASGAVANLVSSIATAPAARRHKERIERALHELEAKTAGQDEAIRRMSDEQFKVVGECLLALNETVEADKVAYLQQIALNSIGYGDYSSYESILLSRVIRDISAEEIKFLIENFSYATVNIYSWHDDEDESEEARQQLRDLKERISQESGLLLLPSDAASLVANGLVSLGVLVPEQLSLGVHKYKYSGIAVKLIVLLRRSSVSNVGADQKQRI